jgi:hypothetical protein
LLCQLLFPSFFEFISYFVYNPYEIRFLVVPAYHDPNHGKVNKSALYHPTFFEQEKALILFWSQPYLHNPTANVHCPHHED